MTARDTTIYGTRETWGSRASGREGIEQMSEPSEEPITPGSLASPAIVMAPEGSPIHTDPPVPI